MIAPSEEFHRWKSPQILDVYALSEIDPLFVVSYQWLQRQDCENTVVFDAIFEPGFNHGLNSTVFPNIILGTPELQKHLVYVLSRNSRLLDEDYLSSRKEAGISCLVPLFPLSGTLVGSLSIDTACAQCGKAKSKRCTGCRSVSYCSEG